MKKWICLFVFFAFLQASAQYSYTYTDPCTLQSKSVFVPAGGGVMVNYFDNHNIFTSNDFSSGVFDAWITQVSQQNSNSPCQSVTTSIVNNVSTAVVSNTINIVTNVVSISSLAQTMASVMTSTTGGALTSTAESISNSNTGGSSDSSNENNSNESTTGNNTGGSSANVNSNQGSQQSQGNSNSVQGSGTNSNNQGGTAPKTAPKTTGVTSGGSKQTTTGNQQTSTPVTQSQQNTSPTGVNQQTTTPTAGGTTSGASGNTANSVSNSIDGGSSDNSSAPKAENSETTEGKSGGGSNLANSLSNAADGGGSDSSSSSSGGGSKKESSAKASTGSLIASGDMVVIANADNTQPNQYKFVGSITHANTRGTRIKGILFNYTTGVNNFNVTLYKSYINKSRKLNTVVANSTMINTDKDIFNTTTALESYKVNKKVTGMFGLNFTAGRLGERNFYNLSAVVGGHAPIQVTKRVSTSILVLGIYSPFTQFYEGQWWSAGVLVVPFNSWDFKITKTFKYNISATAVYSYGESFLNYQVLTGGKLNF